MRTDGRPERGAGVTPLANRGRRPVSPALGFSHPWSFWLGVAAVTAGVLLHLPMFLGARDNHYILRGMPWDRWMIIGMLICGIWM